MFSSNKWNKKEGSPSSFWRKRQLISLNSSVFIENVPSFERVRTRARAKHAKIDAQKGCAMQLNGITLKYHGHLIFYFFLDFMGSFTRYKALITENKY